MIARVHCAGWMLKVRTRSAERPGQGWPGFPAVYTIQFGGMNEDDHGRPLVEIVGEDAVRDLIEKLQAALKTT